MIGVMVPSVFAEEIRMDKSSYFKGEGILFYVTNGVENTKYQVIMPNGNQQTVTLWGPIEFGYLSTENLYDSGTYVIQGPNSNVSFTLDAGPTHPPHPQIFDQSEYFFISDYLLYENQTFHVAMKFDYVVYDEPIILNIFNPSGVSIGSKILEYDLDNWNIRIPLNDFNVEDIGKHKVTLSHAGTTLQDEIYYAGSPPSINTNGEYSINTSFTGIHKVSAVFENGMMHGFNSNFNSKDNSIQLTFWSFFDEGSITITVPHKIIDSPDSPFVITLNWEEVEFEQTRNSQSNTFKIPVKNQYDFLESDYSQSGTIIDDQILMIKGTQSEGSDSVEFEDTLYLVNEVQSPAYSCFNPTISTIDGNLLCNLGDKIKIFTMDGNPLVEFGSFGQIHFMSTVGDEIYVISSNNENESTNIQTFTSKGKLIKTISVDFEGNSGESLSCCSFIKYDNHIYLKFGYGWNQYTLDGELLIEDLRWMPPSDHVVDSDGNHFGVWDYNTLVKYSKYDETQYLDHPMFDNPTKKIIFTIGFDGNVPDPIPLNHNTLFDRIFVDSNDNVITMWGGTIQKFSNDGILIGEYTNPRTSHGTQGSLSGIGPDDSFFLENSYMLYQYTTKNPVESEKPIIESSPVLKTESVEDTPEIISTKLGITSFVDTSKDPQHYIDRYNNEPSYKQWFDENYSQYSSIYQAVGLDEPLGIASFVDQTKDPQSYVDRYNNEGSYKQWFDENYSQYSSIYEAIGMKKPIVEYVSESISEPITEYTPEPITEVTPMPNCGIGTIEKDGICVPESKIIVNTPLEIKDNSKIKLIVGQWAEYDFDLLLDGNSLGMTYFGNSFTEQTNNSGFDPFKVKKLKIEVLEVTDTSVKIKRTLTMTDDVITSIEILDNIQQGSPFSNLFVEFPLSDMNFGSDDGFFGLTLIEFKGEKTLNINKQKIPSLFYRGFTSSNFGDDTSSKLDDYNTSSVLIEYYYEKNTGMLIKSKQNFSIFGIVPIAGQVNFEMTFSLSMVDNYIPTPKSSKGGGCLIATATYGSELSPQVQQLRELRDNQLLQTESGTAFMGTFNDIYYSFSPIIADYERENPLFKEAVKLAITPMISSLSLMENANSESEVLGIGISVIMLNLGMYLGVPAVVVVGIRKITQIN